MRGRELRLEGESEQCGPFPDERALERIFWMLEQAGLEGTKTGRRTTGYTTTSGRRHSGIFKIDSLLTAHSSHVENRSWWDRISWIGCTQTQRAA